MAAGFVGNDTVTVAGLQARSALFGQVTKLDGISFLATKYDGVLGLGWSSLSVAGMPPIFDLLYQQGKLEGNSFSFYLTKKPNQVGSALVLGGTNPKYAASAFKYYPILQPSYWSLALKDILFNGTSYKTSPNLQAILDTGASIIAGPTAVVDRMLANLGPGAQKQVDCDKVGSLPRLEFRIGMDSYVLKGEDYVLEVTEFGMTVCLVGIIGVELPPEMG